VTTRLKILRIEKFIVIITVFNFTNIFRSAFLYESFVRSLHFSTNNIGTKAAHKMLVKLTSGLTNGVRLVIELISNQCFFFLSRKKIPISNNGRRRKRGGLEWKEGQELNRRFKYLQFFFANFFLRRWHLNAIRLFFSL
jgi:hypothetical protein